MQTRISVASIASFETRLLAVPLYGFNPSDPILASLDKATKGQIVRLARQEGFKGLKGQHLELSGSDRLKADRLLLIGLGASPGKAADSDLRSAAAAVGRRVRGLGLKRFGMTIPRLSAWEPARLIHCLTEGAHLGIYRFSKSLSRDRRPKQAPGVFQLLIPTDGLGSKPSIDKACRRAVVTAQKVASGVILARDLVNEPPNEMSPIVLADRAKELAERHGIKASVMTQREIERRGMQLLAAVARGSKHEARFIHLHYTPRDAVSRGTLALVGKGITFDAGGLCLKPPAAQPEMKSDMAGAATVLGVIDAAAACQVPWELHGLIPSCENMPGGDAFRPGDVVGSLGGKTVEIVNTDAEGRLILADALSFATSLQPDAIIDFATLTGACVVALGPYTAGLFANDEEWAARLSKASRRAGEDFWPMPLNKALRDQLKSQVADLKNLGSRWGGAITAALFLQEFVGSGPWLHLDIAGPAFLEKAHGAHSRGGTGFGVMTMMELLTGDAPAEG